MIEPDANVITHGCCADAIEIYSRLAGDRIAEATLMTDGLQPAQACGSVLTAMVQGLSLEEADSIGPGDLILALDGLPKARIHCAGLLGKSTAGRDSLLVR